MGNRMWIGALALALLCGAAAAGPLAAIERDYRHWRDQYFALEVAAARASLAPDEMQQRRDAQARAGAALARRLHRLGSAGLAPPQRRARALMQAQLAAPAPAAPVRCADRAAALGPRTYACYGDAAGAVHIAGGMSDRLGVLALLAREADPAARRALFLALEPVWRSVNGDNTPDSPYRTLVVANAAAWRSTGSPIARAADSLGLDPEAAEANLVAILDAWRARTAPQLVEPWDWYYLNHGASRALSARIARADLEGINARYYRAIGADPGALGIAFDLAPRPGKTPVAFTQFARSAGSAGATRAWVFATYRSGGFDNLLELLHETGHAIHISAIDTRPAFADWPDSDSFTEALADLPALEAYEGQWQQAYLGAQADAQQSLREKHSAIVMDVAWALFELRQHRDPQQDPNQLWSEITRHYLRIAPHPQWSWWAMRGQLIESPGYMSNYAFGAMATAALRQRAQALQGPFATAGSARYGWLAQQLYRFGQERPARVVLEQFLGAPLTVQALVDDIGRLPAPASGQ